MKTILVPTDFSECANNALLFAAFIAKKTGATINLLHVADNPPTEEGGFSRSPDVHEMLGSLMNLKKAMAKLMAQQALKGIKIKDMIAVGVPHIHIVDTAKKCKAQMIIMGTTGASGLGEVLVGSNAEKVARNANVPVITLKNKITSPKIEKIVYATDFAEETYHVFPVIKNFAEIFGAKIEIVKVITESTFETGYQSQKLIDQFKRKFRFGYYSTHIYNDLSKHSGIRHFAHAIKANMIALGTHGKQGLVNLFDGSIAEKLVNHSTLPVLTLNIPKRVQNSEPEKIKASNGKVKKEEQAKLSNLTTFSRISI